MTTEVVKVDYWSKAITEIMADAFLNGSRGYQNVYEGYCMQNSDGLSIDIEERNLSILETILVKTAYENCWSVNRLLRTVIEVRGRF